MSQPAPTPKPCPHCGVAPVLKREPGNGEAWFVGCSNELDCPVWPLTYLHATAAEAIAAWDDGLTH